MVKQVDQTSFSGRRAVQQGQQVLYVTQRCVMRVTETGLEVSKIAPGIDLQRDVLHRVEARLGVASDLKQMDEALFHPVPVGLGQQVRSGKSVRPSRVASRICA